MQWGPAIHITARCKVFSVNCWTITNPVPNDEEKTGIQNTIKLVIQRHLMAQESDILFNWFWGRHCGQNPEELSCLIKIDPPYESKWRATPEWLLSIEAAIANLLAEYPGGLPYKHFSIGAHSPPDPIVETRIPSERTICAFV